MTNKDAEAIRQQVAREKQEYDWVPYGNDVWADQIELLVAALEKIEDGCADPPLLARIALASVRQRGERDE